MNELLRKLLFLPEQASSVAYEIDLLHYSVIGVTFVGWAFLTILGNYFLFRYRRRHEGQATTNVRPPLWFELTLLSGLLTLFLVWWAVGFVQFSRLRTPPDDAMEIYVTGQQWMWKFGYPNGRSDITELTVPLGRPVKLLLTSRDVIHSFFVPAFRIKQDAVPGRYNTVWFTATLTGSFDIFCTEYCGLWHSGMAARVRVLSPEDYDRWLEDTEPSGAEASVGAALAVGGAPAETPKAPDGQRIGAGTGMAAYGEELAARYGCLGCHTLDGRRHLGPSWRDAFGRDVTLADGRIIRADEAYMTRSMMDPNAELVQGFAPIMPSYLGILRPGEVGALLELIKSLEGPPETPPLIPPLGGGG